MPNVLSNFMGSSKPKLITLYTSGTGMYVPTADMARCLVRIQAGGGGGGTVPNIGGGGGAMLEVFLRVPIAGYSYTVGAGGAASTDGSKSSFYNFVSMPGLSGASSGLGGMLFGFGGSVDADGVTMYPGSNLTGVSGGAGGYSGSSFPNGQIVGFPLGTYSSNGYSAAPANNYYWTSNISNGQGSGSGGDSFYGKGGTSGSAPSAGNYGAGGGGHATTPGAGLGGCIEIWDYGA